MGVNRTNKFGNFNNSVYLYHKFLKDGRNMERYS